MQSKHIRLLIIALCVALAAPLILALVLALGAFAVRKPAQETTAPVEETMPMLETTTQTVQPETTTAPETTTETPATTQIERIPPEDYKAFYPDDKVVAFTFDDGPGAGTEMILDTIEGTDDKVTFFINGYRLDFSVEKHTELIRRGLEEGCEYGSHTYNHTILYNSSTGSIDSDKIYDELNSLQLKYRTITGETMQLLRPPGGNFDKHRHYGYAVIHWSVDSEDWRSYAKHKSALTSKDDETREKAEDEAVGEIVSKVLKEVRSGDIILMHDLYNTSAMAFRQLYKELKAQGYRFVTVSDLLRIDAGEFDGWYFYASYSCGKDGVADIAKLPSAPETPTLPPTKIDEE